MRGEDAQSALVTVRWRGSPPHARGRRRWWFSPAGRHGITPACAGKTQTVNQMQRRAEDHPRMRGEDFECVWPPHAENGSPPHARGRHGEDSRRTRFRRITPACAGKTRVSRRFITPGRDHPRMRGEDSKRAMAISTNLGSPPHARGRHRCDQECAVGHGITPACAGKTRGVLPRFARRRGSPPHARGRSLPEKKSLFNARITPRMRGEDFGNAGDTSNPNGSPPHARGRPVAILPDGERYRITPACAGKTDRAFA